MLEVSTKEPLKIHRVRAGLTQEELGRKLNVSGSVISWYERDVNNLRKVKYERIEELARALGVTVDDIFLG